MRPLDAPILDDLGYEELLKRAREVLPLLAPEWTDHNPSDPGVMLVEVLAWITDSLLFQADHVSDEARRALATLVVGRGPELVATTGDAAQLARDQLDERVRAITADDIEGLVHDAWPKSAEAVAAGHTETRFVVLAVLDQRRPAADGSGLVATAANHTTIVVRGADTFRRGIDRGLPAANPQALAALARFVDSRRLVGCHLHVSSVRVRQLSATVHVEPQPTVDEREARLAAEDAIAELLDPISGGERSTGWPLGRGVAAPELAAAIDRRDREVDYVENIAISDASGQREVFVTLDEDELPWFIRSEPPTVVDADVQTGAVEGGPVEPGIDDRPIVGQGDSSRFDLRGTVELTADELRRLSEGDAP